MNEKFSLINVTISQVICSTILVMLILDQKCFCGEFSQLGDKKRLANPTMCFWGFFLKFAIS